MITISIITWLLFFFLNFLPNSSPTHTHTLIVLLAFVNPMTAMEIENNPINVISFSLFAIYLMNRPLFTILALIVMYITPIYTPIILMKQLMSSNAKNGKLFLTIVIIGSIASILKNQSVIFPLLFAPKSNAMWILYSHMFRRYLPLYQALMFTVPYLTIYPIFKIQCKDAVKIAIQYYICMYTAYDVTGVHLWGLYYLYARMIWELISCGEYGVRNLIILTIISLMVTIVTVASYCIYWRMIWLWSRTHVVSQGYFIVQCLLFWIPHGVYLVEILVLEKQRVFGEKQEKGNFKERVKKYLIEKVKEM